MTTDAAAAPGRAPHDPPAEPAGPTVSRAELDKVIAERQAAKARARKAEAELAALRRRLADSETPPPAVEAAPTAADDGADAPGPADRPAAADGSGPARPADPTDPPDSVDAETELAELRRKLQRRDEQLAGILRDRDLRDAAAAAGAVNPDQVVALLRHRVAMRQGPDGHFVPEFLDEAGRPLLDDDGPVDRVDVFVARFLAQPGNANLVRAGATPGSGARCGPIVENDRPGTLAAFHRLAPDQRRAAAMAMTRQQRQALLGLAHPADAGYLAP